MSQTSGIDTSEIVVVIIKNRQDDFFVHQRDKNKKTFPGFYGLGIGGHIKTDENYEDAAKRELKEEAGLKAPINYLFSIKYQPVVGPSYNIFVYETITEQKISTFIEEWQWSGWLSKAAVDKLQSDKKLCLDTAIFYQKYKSMNYPRSSDISS